MVSYDRELRDPQLQRVDRRFTLARVRRLAQMARPSRKKLSLARVRRDLDTNMSRNSRKLSLARVRRGYGMQRTARRLSLARSRPYPTMVRRVRQLSLARV